MSDHTPQPGFGEKLLQMAGRALPNCFAAMDLVEKGLEQPLKPWEKIKLKYHSPLCLHCSCNRRKFDQEMVKLKALQNERGK